MRNRSISTLRYTAVLATLGCLAVIPAAYAADAAPAAQSAAAKPASGNMEAAKSFVDHMAQTGIGFLGNQNMSEAQRSEEFRKLLNSSFDMATIGRFAMGRYWKVATAPQQVEYQKLFKDMIVKVYSRRFHDYNGQKLEVVSAKADADGDTIVTSSIIPPQGQTIQVDWRVRGGSGSYKIVDIVVDGVSMALTQRSDFASVIQSGGGKVDVLIDHLRQLNSQQ